MEEIWKDIEGYEDYQVSSLGRVKSLGNSKTKKEKILKSGTDRKGYFLVGLHKDGTQKTCHVHRLVAQAFIPNPNNLPEVNHKSEIKTDNNVNNLEWCDRVYNVNYGTGIRRGHQKQINNPNISKPVKQLSLDGDLIAVWPSLMEAERNGFYQSNISACCKGKRKTAYGYKWEYLNSNIN